MKVNTEPATGTQLDSKKAHSTIRPAALDSIAKLAQNTVSHRVSRIPQRSGERPTGVLRPRERIQPWVARRTLHWGMPTQYEDEFLTSYHRGAELYSLRSGVQTTQVLISSKKPELVRVKQLIRAKKPL